MKDFDYKDAVRKVVIPLENINEEETQPFRRLSQEIYQGKENIRINSVDFVVVKILNHKKQINEFRKRLSFDVYAIGSFRKTFIPTEKVSEAFVSFYQEMGVLPNIIPIPEHLLRGNKKILSILKNCVLIYERG